MNGFVHNTYSFLQYPNAKKKCGNFYFEKCNIRQPTTDEIRIQKHTSIRIAEPERVRFSMMASRMRNPIDRQADSHIIKRTQNDQDAKKSRRNPRIAGIPRFLSEKGLNDLGRFRLEVRKGGFRIRAWSDNGIARPLPGILEKLEPRRVTAGEKRAVRTARRHLAQSETLRDRTGFRIRPGNEKGYDRNGRADRPPSGKASEKSRRQSHAVPRRPQGQDVVRYAHIEYR